jgi:predicted transcriptional regulator
MAIGNPVRLKIVEYCNKPRRFTDIVMNLKLNPASFKFHSGVLIDCNLIEKVERGVYKTTVLGNLLLDLVENAARLSAKNCD